MFDRNTEIVREKTLEAGGEKTPPNLVHFRDLPGTTKEDGVVVAYSSATAGNMALKAPSVARRRRDFLNLALIRQGQALGLNVHQMVYMLPNLGPPEVIENKPHSKDIRSGPEALVWQEREVGVVMQPRDCPPVYLWDRQEKVAGFVHSSYKAVDRNMIAQTVALMKKRFASSPENISALVGPGIQAGKYHRPYFITHTQSPKFWRQFLLPADLIKKKITIPGEGEKTIFFPSNSPLALLRSIPLLSLKALTNGLDVFAAQFEQSIPHLSLNLQGAITHQLQQAGLPSSMINVSPLCTFELAQEGRAFSRHALSRRGLRRTLQNKPPQNGNALAIFALA